MKKLLTVIALMAALLVPVMASAEETPADAKKGPALENRKEVTADQMISRIEGRKAKILEKIKERFEKLNEKLAGFEGRIDKISARKEKRARKGGEGKIEGDATEKPAMSEEKSKERKEKVTERYNKFKKNIETRRDEMAKRQEENKAKFLARIEKFSQADKDRVIAAQEKMQSEVRAEVSKLADEALKKLEATYQKIMSL
ncbi:MAG TPA: hypothetical protein PKN29_05420 [Candidatus Ozemobacteraceae bacterium]|nr:hypothetical protein [Candidatus Ozemobacteraceae bacterium]HNW10385.1 hypothetical protein [Candidatus Rifleibacterium sp.]